MSYPGSGYPGSGYPGGGQAPSGYSGGGQAPSGYPGGATAPSGYPGGAQAASGYPGQAPSGYPGGQPQSGYPGGGGQPASGYPGYPGGGGGGINPQVQQWFNAVDVDKSGRINARELQGALVSGQGKQFSETACNLMIGMFDRDKSGLIDINEFQHLYNYMNQWLAVFRSYDKDNSSFIDEGELSQALQQMGYRFSPQFVNFVAKKCDPRQPRVTVDQFIVLCVQIQRFTGAFRSRDKEMKGVISIGFEDFLTVALSCSV